MAVPARASSNVPESNMGCPVTAVTCFKRTLHCKFFQNFHLRTVTGRFQKLCSLEYLAIYKVQKLINAKLEQCRIDLGLNHFKRNNVEEFRRIRSRIMSNDDY